MEADTDAAIGRSYDVVVFEADGRRSFTLTDVLENKSVTVSNQIGGGTEGS